MHDSPLVIFVQVVGHAPRACRVTALSRICGNRRFAATFKTGALALLGIGTFVLWTVVVGL